MMQADYLLSGRTRFTAIFGDPVEHSLSPAMHNAAYTYAGLDRRYIAFHVIGARLRAALKAIPALGILGINLTIPHKERAATMISQLSEEARLLGAINCVVNRNGELYGDNTDARGLEGDLRDSGLVLNGKCAMIIGAGGAAASALLACIRLGAAKILLCNRTLVRAQRLARRFARQFDSTPIEACELDFLQRPDKLAEAALIINATSIGLGDGNFLALNYDATLADCIFYDLIYARVPTPFLKPALALGRLALDGAGMLVNQGELAFELFNGCRPPENVMQEALMAALGREAYSRRAQPSGK